MPNRIIRESILTSPKVGNLDFPTRWLFLGLLLSADDQGRIEYASNKLINAKIFPRDTICDADVERMISNCSANNMLMVYEAGGSRYIQIFNFRQQARTKSKHPAPKQEEINSFLLKNETKTHETSNCVANDKQLMSNCIADDKQLMSNCVADDKQLMSNCIADDKQLMSNCIADDKQLMSNCVANDKQLHSLGVVVVGGEGGGVVVTQGAVAPRSQNFIKPTVQELKDYASEIGYTGFDAERFFDFYECKGWFVGKNKMKDWRAAVRNWRKGDRQEKQQKQTTSGLAIGQNYQQEGYVWGMYGKNR